MNATCEALRDANLADRSYLIDALLEAGETELAELYRVPRIGCQAYYDEAALNVHYARWFARFEARGDDAGSEDALVEVDYPSGGYVVPARFVDDLVTLSVEAEFKYEHRAPRRTFTILSQEPL